MNPQSGFSRIKRLAAAWLITACTSVLPLGTAAQSEGAANEWPVQVDADFGTVIIYQPQLESYSGNTVEARSAVSVTVKGTTQPVFGAMWFKARLATEMDTRMASCESITVTAAKFPDVEQSKVDRLSRYLEKEIPQWQMTYSIDRLVASMSEIDRAEQKGGGYNHDAPEIIYVEYPAVLIPIDGDPILADLENSSLEYVANTPYYIVQDTKSKTYYLKGGDYWYTTKDLMRDWATTTKLPDEVKQLDQQIKEEEKKQAAEDGSTEGAETTDDVGESPIPKIIVRTRPAELIEIDGQPQMAPVEGTELLYIENTENDIVLDISSQTYYLLLSGRWYASPSLAGGTWSFVPNDKLPADFAKIPPDSDMGQVLASVAGTQEAREAVLENQIPQTAEVDRKTAKVTVTYDGDPKFEKCADQVAYAVNTDKSVLLVNNTYYCCNDAIWFVSQSPTGPWQVATEVPKEIQDIPADCPAYNVKYVYIYDSTPDVVYVGYTPAYYGSYYYGGCVVWGTGFRYHPWYGTVYYPRPVTYGFRVHYNPVTGWGFSFGVSVGWLHIGFGRPLYGGWWGPHGYRHGYRHGYHAGYRHGYHRGARAGYRAGYKAGQRQASRNNLYKNQAGVRRATASPARAQTARKAPKTTNRPNNHYADKSGNVYRNQGGNTWQKSNNRSNSWSSASPNRSMQNSYSSRQRGAQKSRQSTAQRSGGGGRRR